MAACCEDIFFSSGPHALHAQPHRDEEVIVSSITLPQAALVEAAESLSDDEHENEYVEKTKLYNGSQSLQRHWTVGSSDATARSSRKLQGPLVASVIAFSVLALRFSMHWNSK